MSRLPLRVLLLLALAPVPAGAEPLSDALNTLAGREVTIEGRIGTGLDITDDEALFFRNDLGTFPVVFDAGRTARRSVETCEFGLFAGEGGCEMTGMAEIEIDGSRIRLIVYQVDSIEPQP